MFVDLRARALKPLSAVVLIALFAIVVLLLTMSNLIAAGMNADSTARLTPPDEGLWVWAVCSFAVLMTAGTALISARVRPRHPVIVTMSALLFALGVSQLAFDVYWWWAAGSYADMANKLIPRSEWRSVPGALSALLATGLFGMTTVLLLTRGTLANRRAGATDY